MTHVTCRLTFLFRVNSIYKTKGQKTKEKENKLSSTSTVERKHEAHGVLRLLRCASKTQEAFLPAQLNNARHGAEFIVSDLCRQNDTPAERAAAGPDERLQ